VSATPVTVGRLDPPSAVVHAAEDMRRLGLTVSSLGNVSLRVEDRIWITPTRVLADDLEPADLVALDLEGRALSPGTPSREVQMHLALYRRDPAVAAIIHTHSPWATAWSHRSRDLDVPTEELRYHGIRRIPCAAWAPAGSARLASTAAAALHDSPVALLARHGVVALGPSLSDAIELAAVAEQQAHIQWLLRLDALRMAPRDLPGG
jgi:L-fuculose-phosphate aldolase